MAVLDESLVAEEADDVVVPSDQPGRLAIRGADTAHRSLGAHPGEPGVWIGLERTSGDIQVVERHAFAPCNP
jgi:hypothetical protein